MEARQQSRYKLKRLRKKKPEIALLISAEPESDPLFRFAAEHQDLFEQIAFRLYDSVWPEWKKSRVLQISLQFLDETEMARINGEYRHIDAPTDVLTFPLFEENGRFLPDTMTPLALGDIILCPAVIRRNAEEHSVSAESELALVVFHGMLHLLAWDHDTPERQEKMWAVQERFRDLFLDRLKAEALPREEKL